MDEFKFVKKEHLESVANARTSEYGSDMIDAVLLTDGREFPVHTFILSMRSEYFKTFFKSSLNSKVNQGGDLEEDENRNLTKRRKVQKCLLPAVFQIDQYPDVLEKILQFIYLEEKCKEFGSIDEAKATLIAANRYLLTSYEKICGSYLSSKLSAQNFIELYNIGILLENKIMIKAARKLSCEDLEMNIEMLSQDAFNDYFKHVSKYYPNEAILQLHKYYSKFEELHKRTPLDYPMQNIHENIDWSIVKDKTFEILNMNQYMRLESLNTIVIHQLAVSRKFPKVVEEIEYIKRIIFGNGDENECGYYSQPYFRHFGGNEDPGFGEYDSDDDPSSYTCIIKNCPVNIFKRICAEKDKRGFSYIKEEILNFETEMNNDPERKCCRDGNKTYDTYETCPRSNECMVNLLKQLSRIVLN